MALTGAFLVLFVTFHALMNGVALFWPAAYNVVCEFLGANWYALAGTLVLAAGVVLHIVFATWLTLQNRKARGVERYAVTSRPKQVEWSSKNMLVLGIVVVAFLVIHFIQFWAKMQFAEICELVPHDPRLLVDDADRWLGQRHMDAPPQMHRQCVGHNRNRSVRGRGHRVHRAGQPQCLYHLPQAG